MKTFSIQVPANQAPSFPSDAYDAYLTSHDNPSDAITSYLSPIYNLVLAPQQSHLSLYVPKISQFLYSFSYKSWIIRHKLNATKMKVVEVQDGTEFYMPLSKGSDIGIMWKVKERVIAGLLTMGGKELPTSVEIVRMTIGVGECPLAIDSERIVQELLKEGKKRDGLETTEYEAMLVLMAVVLADKLMRVQSPEKEEILDMLAGMPTPQPVVEVPKKRARRWSQVKRDPAEVQNLLTVHCW
jgi:hypothetical protein